MFAIAAAASIGSPTTQYLTEYDGKKIIIVITTVSIKIFENPSLATIAFISGRMIGIFTVCIKPI